MVFVKVVGVDNVYSVKVDALIYANNQMLIIDDDTIDESNLQRQSLFTPNDISQSKALVAKAKLHEINAFCDVIAIQARLTADNYQQMVDMGSTQNNTDEALNQVLQQAIQINENNTNMQK